MAIHTSFTRGKDTDLAGPFTSGESRNRTREENVEASGVLPGATRGKPVWDHWKNREE